jgi:hypothetical protein
MGYYVGLHRVAIVEGDCVFTVHVLCATARAAVNAPKAPGLRMNNPDFTVTPRP